MKNSLLKENVDSVLGFSLELKQALTCSYARCKVFINRPRCGTPWGVNHNAFIVVVHPGGLIITINAL